MKIIRNYIIFLMTLAALTASLQSRAQCTATFSFIPGPGGSFTFSNTSAISATSTLLSWSFGNGTQSVAVTSPTASCTYTSNGYYVVSMGIITSGPTCTSVATQTIMVTSAAVPPCTMQINFTAPTASTLCNGSGQVVANSSMCGPVTYTWFPSGINSPTVAGLCAGSAYTVFASSPTSTASGCCPQAVGFGTVPTPSTACNLSVSITNTFSGGAYSFSSTSTGTTPSSTYFWSFGDGSFLNTGTAPTANHTYSANGGYNVKLIVTNSFTPAFCQDSSVVNPIVVSIPTASCNLVGGFSVSPTGTPGAMFFNSTSTGTVNPTIFKWTFGDGSLPTTSVNLPSTAHTYSASGTYSAILQLTNTSIPGCTDSVNVTVIVSGPCNLAANFALSVGAGGLVSFTNTSTGNLAGASYTMAWGDGTSSNLNPFTNTTHQYSGNGYRTATLTVQTSSACINTSIKSFLIPCALIAGFSHTVGSGGAVNFKSTSAGTTPGTSYTWYFGDGVYTSGDPALHTYAAAGAYNVMLRIAGDSLCADSVVQSVNVTGIACSANSNFILTPSGTPQYWNATPAYPWNVSAASWDWGDGSTSNLLYTSHTYAQAGSYNICLSVTVTCGSTASTCASYAVFRTLETNSNQGVVHVNVMKPSLSTGIAATGPDEAGYSLYPNPNRGEFYLNLAGLTQDKIQISIYNLMGELVFADEALADGGNLLKEIHLADAPAGIYLVQIRHGNSRSVQKMVVTGQ